MPAGVSGKGGHNATFAAAVALVHGFALGKDEAWALLLEFNTRCEPPWSTKELSHKLEDARKLDRYPHPYGHLSSGGDRRRGPRTQRFRVSGPPAEEVRVIGRTVLPEDLSTRLPTAKAKVVGPENEWQLQLNFDDKLAEPSFKEQVMEWLRQVR
jgi:hypothetical protein